MEPGLVVDIQFSCFVVGRRWASTRGSDDGPQEWTLGWLAAGMKVRNLIVARTYLFT